MRKTNFTDDMYIGIQEIDDQHQRLVFLINKLTDSVRYRNTKEIVDETLVEILDYSKSHFAFEETLLSAKNYKKLDEHKKEHEFYLDEIVNIIDKHKDDSVGAIANTHMMLSKWIRNHIMISDKNYAKAINK